MADISAEALKAAIDQWSTKTHPSLGLAEYRDTAIERVFGSNPLLFTRGQEVVNQILDYNRQLGNPLTETELVAGINKFSKSQYDQYGRNYQVDSDPFNIGRWSVALALIDKGMSDAGSALIKATDDRQAITSQQAIELGKLADDQYTKMSAKYDELSQPHSASFGDILGATITGLGVMFAPVGIAGALGGLAGGAAGSIGNLVGFGGAETASLGSGISSGAGGVTGISAGAGGATGVTGSVAGLSGGVLAPAATGGWLVGSDGLIGSTGNAIGDAVLNNAGQSVIKSAVTGEDPLKAAVTGAAGGLISSSGVLNDVSAAITPDDAGRVATTAIQRGVNAAGTNLLTTGDIGTAAEAGLISGVGNYAGGTAAENGANNVVAGAVGGGAAGATNAVLQDGNIVEGAVIGAAGGGAAGAATELGANSTVANTIGSVVGGIVGSELADDQTATGGAAAGTGAAVVPPPFEGLTFADMLPPEFVDVKSTRVTDWGSNRLATAGRI